MKKFGIIGVIVLVLGLAAFTVPVLANGQDDGAGPGKWQAMWDACRKGDWDVMLKAARDFHGGAVDNIPCREAFDEDDRQAPLPFQGMQMGVGGVV